MYPDRLLKPLGLFLLSVLALLIVGCGTDSTSVAATASPTATCPPIRTRGATGTLQSVNGNALVLTNQQGKTVNVNITGKTTVILQSLATTSVLTSGTFVTVAVKQNQDNTYTATRIMLGQRFNGNGNGNRRFGNGNRGQGRQGINQACSGRRRGGNNGNFGNGAGGTGARAITGSVGQFNGSTLVVSAPTGDDFTITLDKTTQILQSKSVTASALKAGMKITVVGTPDSHGVITAQAVTILLSNTKTGQ